MRGFALLSTAKKREISSLGGKTSHALGTAYKFTSEAAKKATEKREKLRAKRKKDNANNECEPNK